MGVVLDSLVTFSSQVSENIGSAFREIALFIKQISLVGLNLYFTIVVLLFFATIALMIMLPVRFKPYYVQIKKMFIEFFEKLDMKKLNKDK